MGEGGGGIPPTQGKVRVCVVGRERLQITAKVALTFGVNEGGITGLGGG